MNHARLLTLLALCGILAGTVPAWGQTRGLPVGGGDPADGVHVVIERATDAGMGIEVRTTGAYAASVAAPNGREYVQLSVAGCGAAADGIGRPELPFKGVLIEVPYGVDVSVEVVDAAWTSLGRGFTVYPAQPPLPDDGSVSPAFQMDEAAYLADRFYPAGPVVLGEPGFIRGRRVVFAQVFPLQYNPGTTELRALAKLRFRLRFEGAIDQAGEVRKARLATPRSEALAEALIANHEPIETPFDPSDGRLPDGAAAADYLIIVDDDLYEEALPLAEWKHRKGYVTRMVPLSQIGASSADIKSYIRAAYENWTPAPEYVLIVGDHRDVPAGEYVGAFGSTTDLPYACVDGEDYFPDLTIGRLPVHTEDECVSVVDKILFYERTPDLGDWYDDFLSAGYFQDNGDGGSQGNNDGIADRWFMETTMTIYGFLTTTVGLSGHTALCTTYWPLNHPPDGYHFRDSSYAHRADLNQIRWGASPYPDPVPTWITGVWTSAQQSTQDVSAAINAGVGMVLHRDHGAETLWGDPPYDTGHIKNLSNGDRTPVVFSMNCSTGSFQMYNQDSFCEVFIKKDPGGAVGLVGATRTSFSGFNDLLAHGLMTCFWPAYDPSYTDTTYPLSRRPAEALNYAKFYMFNFMGPGPITEGEFFMFHWFGDPEMVLRLATPRPLEVAHPAEVPYNTPVEIAVQVTQGGQPLAGALVCVSHPDLSAMWRGLTGPDGEVIFTDVLLPRHGDYDLVVSEADSVPYEGVIAGVVTSAGTIRLDRALYSCDDLVAIEAADLDLEGAGTHEVELTGDGGDVETVLLSETGPASAIFTGSITTSAGPVVLEDGTLQVAHGELVAAVYQDDDNGHGQPAVAQDTAETDCQGPAISGARVVRIAAGSVAIEFRTDEPAIGTVRYGKSCGDPTHEVSAAAQGTEHEIILTDWELAARYYFVIDAVDQFDNPATDDNGGACYTFVTPGVAHRFTFDSDPGWATERLWAFGQPTGQGSYNRDPLSGYTGNFVYGYNLEGDYTNELPAVYLTAPPLDCTGLTNVHLSFRRWLGVDSSFHRDEATVEISTDGENWSTVWRATDLGSAVLDYEWTLQQLDISSLAANRPAVRVRWGMGPTDASRARAGWNIDDVEMIATSGLLVIDLPDGLPDYLTPGRLTYVTVRVTASEEDVLPGSALLHYRYDGGDFQAAPLLPLGGDLYRATLPVPRCGDSPEFYFSAEGSLSQVVNQPLDAPARVYTALPGILTVVMVDNFESDQGWTVENSPELTDGAWDRGVPVDCGRGDPPTDFDGSGQCYLTDNSSWLGCNSDVDGGRTWLISPRLDLSIGDADVSYAVWYTNNYGNNAYSDVMVVWVSNDDGANWSEVRTFGPSSGPGWIEAAFAVGDFVSPTDAVRLAFEASDMGQPSVVEAGVDALRVTHFECQPTTLPGDLSCDGELNLGDVNPFILAFTDLPAYEAAYPGCPFENRDVNADGLFDHNDITPLIILLAGK